MSTGHSAAVALQSTASPHSSRRQPPASFTLHEFLLNSWLLTKEGSSFFLGIPLLYYFLTCSLFFLFFVMQSQVVEISTSIMLTILCHQQREVPGWVEHWHLVRVFLPNIDGSVLHAAATVLSSFSTSCLASCQVVHTKLLGQRLVIFFTSSSPHVPLVCLLHAHKPKAFASRKRFPALH